MPQKPLQTIRLRRDSIQRPAPRTISSTFHPEFAFMA
jgi:hypothetical protein